MISELKGHVDYVLNQAQGQLDSLENSDKKTSVANYVSKLIEAQTALAPAVQIEADELSALKAADEAAKAEALANVPDFMKR